MTRPINGVRSLKAHSLSLSKTELSEASLKLNGYRFPITELDTKNLQVTEADVKVKDVSNNTYYKVLHENSQIDVKFDQVGPDPNKIALGQIIPAGNNAKKKASPAPFVYIDETGRLGSDLLGTSIYQDHIMGFTAEGKQNTYAHGLVPAGGAVHSGLFLRKDGQWGQPSIYTGSVSENFLSLQDTPATYNNNIGKYLKASFGEGGSLVFDALDTSKVPEQTNLYYTDTRVDSRIASKASDRSLLNISCQNRLLAKEIVADSDQRLKKNIRPLDSGEILKRVCELQPKQYQFKSDPDANNHFGLIAQQAKAQFPELVCADERQLLSLNYIELVPLLISCVKQLKGELDSLKAQL